MVNESENQTEELADPARRPLLLMFAASAAKLVIDRAFFLGTAACATGTVIGTEFLNWIESQSQQTKDTAALRALGENLLFGESMKKHGVPSVDNPHAPTKGITKPTRYAMDSVLYRLGFNKREIEESKHIDAKVLDSSYLFFGGPVANAYSRAILGVGEVSPILKTKLHVCFDVVTPLSSDQRVSYGHGGGHRPEWRLMVNGAASICVGIDVGAISSGTRLPDHAAMSIV